MRPHILLIGRPLDRPEMYPHTEPQMRIEIEKCMDRIFREATYGRIDESAIKSLSIAMLREFGYNDCIDLDNGCSWVCFHDLPFWLGNRLMAQLAEVDFSIIQITQSIIEVVYTPVDSAPY